MHVLMLALIGVGLWVLCDINQKLGGLMATVAELHDTLAAVAAGVDGLEIAIKDLKAQIAAGGVVSQADLDALAAKAKAIVEDIADTSDQ